MKKRLNQIDNDIKYWSEVVEKYPLAGHYRRILFNLQQKRVDLVSKIGKK